MHLKNDRRHVFIIRITFHDVKQIGKNIVAQMDVLADTSCFSDD